MQTRKRRVQEEVKKDEKKKKTGKRRNLHHHQSEQTKQKQKRKQNPSPIPSESLLQQALMMRSSSDGVQSSGFTMPFSSLEIRDRGKSKKKKRKKTRKKKRMEWKETFHRRTVSVGRRISPIASSHSTYPTIHRLP
jgi:hypothetical protein